MFRGNDQQLASQSWKKSRLKICLSAAKCANNPPRVKKLEDEIGLITYEIKEAILEHLDKNEKRVVDKIKVNPKYFYSYAKYFSKVKHSISTLLNRDKKLVIERKELIYCSNSSVLSLVIPTARRSHYLHLQCHQS